MTFDPPEPWRPDPALPAGLPSDVPPADQPERLRLRPPVGIPRPPSRRLPSVLLSVALHALVVLLILTPVVAPAVLREVAGAGDAGPAGGGGGGQRGTGGDNGGWGVRERLHFIQVAPPPKAAAPAAAPPPVTPPVTPPPVPPPPAPTVPPPPAAAPTPAPAAPAAAAAGVAAATPGANGGSGADGTNGNGPGSGGGVGAGTGTGRGGGTGPGTGGGGAANYLPVPIEAFIPPLPLPRKVAGSRVLAVFDVDSTGRIVSIDFTPTADGGYNRKLREVFSGFRFRPGTRPDGTPVRAKVSVEYEL